LNSGAHKRKEEMKLGVDNTRCEILMSAAKEQWAKTPDY